MGHAPTRLIRAAAGFAALAAGTLVAPPASADTTADYQLGYTLGLEAYKYGLPLVTTDKTFHHQTSINVPNGRGFGPVNQFNPVRTFTTPDDRSVVAPNFDTLYSVAWLDLSGEPQVIRVPKVKDRYFVIPLMDPYTEDFTNLGSVNATAPGAYAVVGRRTPA